jgi:hypothetical protein
MARSRGHSSNALVLARAVVDQPSDTAMMTIPIGHGSRTRYRRIFLPSAAVILPILPLHLTRAVWSILNIVTGGLFAVHFLIARSGETSTIEGVKR